MTQAPSCRDIAAEAKVSPMAVSLALRNSPKISEDTRKAILKVAKRLGYTADPRLSDYMRYIRKRRSVKDRPILAMINTYDAPLSRLESFNIRGIARSAAAEAERQGYKLEEFWLGEKGMTEQRLSRILESRGIVGIVVLPLRPGMQQLNLHWPSFSAVSTCYSAYRLGLNLVSTNRQHYLELTLRELRQLGYRRIGLVIDEDTDERSHHQTLAHFLWDQSRQPVALRVNPLFEPTIGQESLRAWLDVEKPEALVTTRNHVHGLLRKMKISVPKTLGFASLAASARDVASLAGVDERPEAVGISVIDLLVAQLQRHELGMPVTRRLLLVEGSWIPGKTVRSLAAS